MIRSVQIDGYRGLSHFEMSGLGRINLIVGKNNSRKTSVLEALHLLSSAGDVQALWQICGRRGERLSEIRDARFGQPEIDIAHLFTGHEIQLNSKFTLRAKNEPNERMLTFVVRETKENERSPAPPATELPSRYPRVSLHIEGPGGTIRSFPLIAGSGLSFEYLDVPRRISRRVQSSGNPSQFISTDSLTGTQLLGLWDKIALTPNEALVLRALQFLDPRVERIAGLAGSSYYGERGGFIVKCDDVLFPFPIGSLGDGAWRMLAMAIAITQCRDGVLLVDEIDTGLHYTVMSDMWKLIYGAATDLNVQVFATTHSSDCVQSLATICHADVEANSQVTIQRLELERKTAVPFTEAEIRTAAERQIEIR